MQIFMMSSSMHITTTCTHKFNNYKYTMCHLLLPKSSHLVADIFPTEVHKTKVITRYSTEEGPGLTCKKAGQIYAQSYTIKNYQYIKYSVYTTTVHQIH